MVDLTLKPGAGPSRAENRAVTRPEAAPAPAARPPLLIPLIVACALFMENLDSTVLATALPAIARSLDENPLRLNLAITAYLFSLAVFIPISGWVADRFGARTVFRIAIAVFLTGSILCGFSSSLPAFVAARIFQGIGGAMMVPVGRLVVLRSIPKAQFVNAMAYLTVPALIGPILGPPVGGFIATYLSWRWIFWINIPIGILGILLATRFIPALREKQVPPLDLPGFLLTGVALVGLVFGFETAGRGILPLPAVLGLLGCGMAAAVLYTLRARRVAHPIIDLTLLRLPTFRAGVVGGFLFRVGVGATPFLLPMMLQLGFGRTPFESGTLTFVAAAGAMGMKTTAGAILRRWGFRTVLIANAAISSVFLGAIALFRPDTPVWFIIGVLLVGGFFRSLQFTSVNTVSYADVPPPRMSLATSFASAAQQLSLTVGVGMGAMLLHLASAARGSATVSAADFPPAFLGVAAIAALSILWFVRLPLDAGAEISGRGAAGSRRG
jgi:EmrB/QacA subfamily drug resistance transporter